jgi:hypothetical protein
MRTSSSSQPPQAGSAGSPTPYTGAGNLGHYFFPSSSRGGSNNILPINGAKGQLPATNSGPMPVVSSNGSNSADPLMGTQSQQDLSVPTSNSLPNMKQSPLQASAAAKGSSVKGCGGSGSAGVVCLVLEYLDGGSLQSASDSGVLHDREGVVDLLALWPLLVDVVQGMVALHAMGVCHGGGWWGEGGGGGAGHGGTTCYGGVSWRWGGRGKGEGGL